MANDYITTLRRMLHNMGGEEGAQLSTPLMPERAGLMGHVPETPKHHLHRSCWGRRRGPRSSHQINRMQATVYYHIHSRTIVKQAMLLTSECIPTKMKAYMAGDSESTRPLSQRSWCVCAC